MRVGVAALLLAGAANGTMLLLAAKKAPEPLKPMDKLKFLMKLKLRPEWSGTAVDSAAGALVGASCGLVVAKVVETTVRLTVKLTVWSSLKALPLTFQCAIAAGMIAALEKLQIVSFHWEELKARWDGAAKRVDDERRRLLSSPLVARCLGTIRSGSAGGDSAVREQINANQHAAAGAATGLAVGVLASASVARHPPSVAHARPAPSRRRGDGRITVGELIGELVPKLGRFSGLVVSAAKDAFG